MGEINVVPYIDVMLVLLIIFMVTAPLLTQGIEVELPKVGAEPMDTEATEPLVLTVDRDGRMFLNVVEPDQAVDAGVLVQRAAAVIRRSPEKPVLVRADTNTAYGHVALAMRLLQDAGAPSVGMVTDPEALPEAARE
ncbi:MAG: protein TolR [Gammaproteobacteria bacterium]